MSKKSYPKRTYREWIQSEIEAVDERYDLAGSLRDFASENEKDTWNEVRRLTRDVSHILQRLDNRLSQDRADTMV